jgi:hypothetical protein
MIMKRGTSISLMMRRTIYISTTLSSLSTDSERY